LWSFGWPEPSEWPFFMALKYTSTDLSNLKAAIITIATRGSAEVTINGRTVRFLDIDKLQKLIAIVEAEVNGEIYGGMLDVAFVGVNN